MEVVPAVRIPDPYPTTFLIRHEPGKILRVPPIPNSRGATIDVLRLHIPHGGVLRKGTSAIDTHTKDQEYDSHDAFQPLERRVMERQ
jgi:hypothetical protein